MVATRGTVATIQMTGLAPRLPNIPNLALLCLLHDMRMAKEESLCAVPPGQFLPGAHSILRHGVRRLLYHDNNNQTLLARDMSMTTDMTMMLNLREDRDFRNTVADVQNM